MLVAVILGNRLNDDGTPSEILLARLCTALKLISDLKPSKVILSGGMANAKAGIAEATVMKAYLIEHGVDESVLVVEDKSLTTKQNAEFSVPIALQLGATELLLSTSCEHLSRAYLNPIKLFATALKGSNVKLSVYGSDVTQ